MSTYLEETVTSFKPIIPCFCPPALLSSLNIVISLKVVKGKPSLASWCGKQRLSATMPPVCLSRAWYTTPAILLILAHKNRIGDCSSLVIRFFSFHIMMYCHYLLLTIGPFSNPTNLLISRWYIRAITIRCHGWTPWEIILGWNPRWSIVGGRSGCRSWWCRSHRWWRWGCCCCISSALSATMIPRFLAITFILMGSSVVIWLPFAFVLLASCEWCHHGY